MLFSNSSRVFSQNVNAYSLRSCYFVSRVFFVVFVFKMVLHIKSSLKSLENVEHKNVLHYIPCVINSDGPANVSQYFKPTVDDKNYCNASFRGRPLHGQVVPFPDGYKGLVLQEQKHPLVENIERNLHVSHVFDELTYWNYDSIPSSNDAFFKALDWIDISHALHAPDDDDCKVKEKH